MALGLGLAACQQGMSVGFTTAAALVHEMMEARDERRLLNLQRQLSRLNILIIDELGFVPLSRTGAELLFEVFSQRYERGSILVTTNLPFDEWTEIFGSERLTGALPDRLTHHVHILEMNGESYRLKHPFLPTPQVGHHFPRWYTMPLPSSNGREAENVAPISIHPQSALGWQMTLAPIGLNIHAISQFVVGRQERRVICGRNGRKGGLPSGY